MLPSSPHPPPHPAHPPTPQFDSHLRTLSLHLTNLLSGISALTATACAVAECVGSDDEDPMLLELLASLKTYLREVKRVEVGKEVVEEMREALRGGGELVGPSRIPTAFLRGKARGREDRG